MKDDAVIQVYNNEIVRLDRETGKRQWHYKAAKGMISLATLDEEGNVYAFSIEDTDVEHKKQYIEGPGVAVLSLDGQTGQERWLIDLENHPYENEVIRFFPRIMTGPGDGFLGSLDIHCARRIELVALVTVCIC